MKASRMRLAFLRGWRSWELPESEGGQGFDRAQDASEGCVSSKKGSPFYLNNGTWKGGDTRLVIILTSLVVVGVTLLEIRLIRDAQRQVFLHDAIRSVGVVSLDRFVHLPMLIVD